jgi:hypothetical protein
MRDDGQKRSSSPFKADASCGRQPKTPLTGDVL